MSKRFLTNIDARGVYIVGMTPESLSSAPSTNLTTGRIYYDTSASGLKYYNGVSFLTIGAGNVSSVNSLTGALIIQGTTGHLSASSSGATISLDLDPTVVYTGSAQTLSLKTLSSPSFTGGSLVKLGTTSGSITLVVPAISGTASLTYPTTTGTIATQEYVTSSSVAYSSSAGNSASLSGVTASNYVTLTGTQVLTNKTIAVSGPNTISGLTNSNLSGTAGITNANLANTTITIGTTPITLGSSSTAFAGLTSVSATSFTGTLTGTSTGVAGATSAASVSAYMVRDAAGRAQVVDPSAAADIATKNYVDTVAQGLNAHDPVVAATLTTLSANYVNGTADLSTGSGIGATLTATASGVFVIDSASPTVNDRVLIKNQSTALQNGIYTVTASGAVNAVWVLTRATDANNSIAGEFANGDFIWVSGGTTQGSTGWVLNTASTTGTPGKTIKIGTDSVTYAQFSGQGTFNAASGVALTGNTFYFAPTSTGGLSTGVSGAIVKLPTNSGLTTDSNGLYIGAGTGFTLSTNTLNYSSGSTSQSASGVSNGNYTYATQKAYATITGDNATLSFAVAHNLNTRDVNVQVYQTSGTGLPDTQYSSIEVDVTRTSTASVTIGFAVAPAATTTYNVVIVG